MQSNKCKASIVYECLRRWFKRFKWDLYNYLSPNCFAMICKSGHKCIRRSVIRRRFWASRNPIAYPMSPTSVPFVSLVRSFIELFKGQTVGVINRSVPSVPSLPIHRMIWISNSLYNYFSFQLNYNFSELLINFKVFSNLSFDPKVLQLVKELLALSETLIICWLKNVWNSHQKPSFTQISDEFYIQIKSLQSLIMCDP